MQLPNRSAGRVPADALTAGRHGQPRQADLWGNMAAWLALAVAAKELGSHGPILLSSPGGYTRAWGGEGARAVSASQPPVKSTTLAQALTAANLRCVSNEDIMRS